MAVVVQRAAAATTQPAGDSKPETQKTSEHQVRSPQLCDPDPESHPPARRWMIYNSSITLKDPRNYGNHGMFLFFWRGGGGGYLAGFIYHQPYNP